ncbi:MAG: outer membrane beta-barrel protein [Bacteroidetes bacterium]|nr:outer membrane beta-barrel protein [Bacteroidota bacterium]
MKKALAVVLLVILAGGIAVAQEREKAGETKVIIKQTPPEKENYYTIRVGAWFPKDKEKGFDFQGNLVDETNGKIDQSQALGVDLHFRNAASHPLYVDLSVGGWYTSYEFTANDLLNETALIRKNSAYAVIVPVTLGLSIAPLPENPIQPYAMAGIGAYIGITGYDITEVSDQNASASDTYVRFGYYLGAGLDFMFAETFGVSVGAKYQFLEFKDPLYTGQKNFTGLQASVGIAMKM